MTFTSTQDNWTSWGKQEGLTEITSRFGHLRSCLATLNLAIHPQSRLGLFEDQLTEFVRPGYNPFRDGNFDWLAFTEGYRDCAELYFIVETLGKSYSEKLRLELTRAFHGARLPSSDKRTEARNIQFQLYLTAWLKHSGFEAYLEEPDIQFSHDGICYGIAAKRLSSPRQVEKRVREAVHQLERLQLKGFVALSVERLLGTQENRVVAKNVQGLDEAAKELLHRILRKHAAKIQPLLVAPWTLGLITNLSLPALMAMEPGNIGTTSALFWLPRSDDDDVSRRLVESISMRIRDPSQPT
jgi:hypothetical protein